LIGAKDAAAISERVEEENLKLPEAWQELRDDESSRWLCAAANRVVLASETNGPVRRVCLGSPAFAIAAMLAASYRTTGAFARLYGRGGELQAPAVWEPPGAREPGSVAPIEAFLSIRAQSQLAQLGVLGLGSSRNSDMIVLSVAPMARADEHLVPLSGQVLTGRVVRFAQWVRDQLPPDVSREQVPELFSKAAEVFLFAGATDTGSVRGELLTGDDGKPVVQVTARIRAEHAGMPFEVSFALPLRP
jgi:type VI secretion system protein ImpC